MLLRFTLNDTHVGVCILLGHADYWIFCWFMARLGVAALSLDVQVGYAGSGYEFHSYTLCAVHATGHFALCTDLQLQIIATVLLYEHYVL